MKKDLTLGIALILTGSIGLIAQNPVKPPSEPLVAKKAHLVTLESKHQTAVYKLGANAVVCQSNLQDAAGEATLLDKLTSALNDLDTVVTLQRL